MQRAYMPPATGESGRRAGERRAGKLCGEAKGRVNKDGAQERTVTVASGRASVQPGHDDQKQRREVQNVDGEDRDDALREPATKKRVKLQGPQDHRARGSAIGGEEGAHGRSGQYTLSQNTTGEFEV